MRSVSLQRFCKSKLSQPSSDVYPNSSSFRWWDYVLDTEIGPEASKRRCPLGQLAPGAGFSGVIGALLPSRHSFPKGSLNKVQQVCLQAIIPYRLLDPNNLVPYPYTLTAGEATAQ